MANCLSYAAYLEECIKSNIEPEFSALYAFHKAGLACNIAALDPLTQPLQKNDLMGTSLYKAVSTMLVQSILKNIMGCQLGWTLARVRVVLPARAEVDGRLSLHMEKVGIQYPRVHNIWMPLTADGLITNKDVPGIQFLIGGGAFFRNTPENNVNDFLASLQDQIDGETVQVDTDMFLYRPLLRTGDIAIFNGHLPHGGHIPTHATSSRIACDFRLFPWTDVDYSNGNANLQATAFVLA